MKSEQCTAYAHIQYMCDGKDIQQTWTAFQLNKNFQGKLTQLISCFKGQDKFGFCQRIQHCDVATAPLKGGLLCLVEREWREEL